MVTRSPRRGALEHCEIVRSEFENLTRLSEGFVQISFTDWVGFGNKTQKNPIELYINEILKNRVSAAEAQRNFASQWKVMWEQFSKHQRFPDIWGALPSSLHLFDVDHCFKVANSFCLSGERELLRVVNKTLDEIQTDFIAWIFEEQRLSSDGKVDPRKFIFKGEKFNFSKIFSSHLFADIVSSKEADACFLRESLRVIHQGLTSQNSITVPLYVIASDNPLRVFVPMTKDLAP